MYEKDGIVYADDQTPVLEVTEIRHMYSGVYLVKFSDGATKLFDSTILKGEVFEPLKNPEIYENPKLEFGIVTWDDGKIDCSPDFMYKYGYDYNTKDIIEAA